MAGTDPEVNVLMGLTAASGIPFLYGVGDMALGSSNALNSGELFLNPVLGLAAPAAGVVGGLAGLAATAQGRLALQGLLQKGSTPPWENEGSLAPALQAKQDQLIENLMRRDPKLDRSMAEQVLRRRSGWGMIAGAGLGALAAGIPAIMAMRDQPQPEELT